MKFGILTLSDHYPEDKSEEQYYKSSAATAKTYPSYLYGLGA